MKLNQYELALASADYIRRNPDCEVGKKIKACKTQLAISEVFENEILGKKQVLPHKY